MKQFEAPILANRGIAPSWRELVLAWEPEAGRPLPGQFFTFRASRGTDPLLRRPLAFASATGDGLRVSAIYQVRGRATQLLSERSSGSRLDVLGPLGRAFPDSGARPLLAAGGIGLGPILFLARELAAAGPPVVLGFRSAAAIPDLELPKESVICTDDGSRGHHGTLVDWTEAEIHEPPSRVCACGPAPMLAALAGLARRRDWPASFSAEQWMACGVGACMGCALPRGSGGGYLRACADGPVFDRDEIAWEGGA